MISSLSSAASAIRFLDAESIISLLISLGAVCALWFKHISMSNAKVDKKDFEGFKNNLNDKIDERVDLRLEKRLGLLEYKVDTLVNKK